MKKTVIYKEPGSYFSANMMKAAKEWEKENKAAKKAAVKKPAKKK